MKKIFILFLTTFGIVSFLFLNPKITFADCETLITADCSVAENDRTILCVNTNMNLSDFCCHSQQDCDDLLGNGNDIPCAGDTQCKANNQNCCTGTSEQQSTGCSTGIRCVSDAGACAANTCKLQGQTCCYGFNESNDSSCPTGIKCVTPAGGNTVCSNSLGGNCLPHCNTYTHEEDRGSNGCPTGTTCCVVVSTVPADPSDLLCGPDQAGINTAIGCIPVSNTNDFMGWILGWAVGIGGGIAFLLIVYASFMTMTSQGNPERLKAGQELLTSAISGLILLIFSVFILKFIGVDILKLGDFGFGQ